MAGSEFALVGVENKALTAATMAITRKSGLMILQSLLLGSDEEAMGLAQVDDPVSGEFTQLAVA